MSYTGEGGVTYSYLQIICPTNELAILLFKRSLSYSISYSGLPFIYRCKFYILESSITSLLKGIANNFKFGFAVEIIPLQILLICKLSIYMQFTPILVAYLASFLLALFKRDYRLLETLMTVFVLFNYSFLASLPEFYLYLLFFSLLHALKLKHFYHLKLFLSFIRNKP